MQELRALFLEFQERWSLERVKNMTLEEYTGIDKDRDDFTCWIENKLDKLGSIWGIGGGGSFKFGIYKRANDKEKEDDSTYKYNKEYAWCKKYGETPQQAFEQIKSLIVMIIECSQQNKLDEINEIDLVDIYKWKIAFHYQNIDDMGIMCIFSKKVLQNIAKGENLGENLSTAQIYQKLLGDKTYTLETMIDEKSMPLWEKYGLQNNKEKEKMETSNQTNTKKVLSNRQIPLNQILYGPPGTGKTYQTIDKALEILKYHKIIDDNIPKSRLDKKKIFDEYRENGQIAFITFHQSFSYEEFVEGIKPAIANEEGNEMTYKIHSGIFKELCANAMNVYKNSDHQNNHSHKEIDKTKDLYRLYTTPDEDDYFQDCIEKNYVWAYPNYGGNEIKKENMKGNYIIIPDKSTKIRAFGIFGEKSEEKTEETCTKIYREVEWLWKKDSEQESLSIEGVNFGIPTFQRVHKYKDVVLNHLELIINKKNAPYILIIDEINRGNISKILGELITLIEPSKRIGENEALEVILPYSQESFGVPNNLYIIGTMNTADRSIALLDTALRRRFEFIEMMPQPNLLQDCAGVNLQKLLESINHRIEFLLDREHTIGHAYFIGVETLEGLQAVFAKKIIPLLQEYFYEDYAKIDAVLNGNGMIKVDEEISFSKLFINSKFNDFDNEKSVYQITDSGEWKLWQFVKIYDEKKAKELEESLKKDSKIEPTIKENDEN